MPNLKGLEADAVKVFLAALFVVALIKVIQNAGGFATVVGSLFEGATGILRTVAET